MEFLNFNAVFGVRHCSKGDFPKDFIKKKLIKVDEQ
jgi:hypothetical protein